jgi:hypothetical protein
MPEELLVLLVVGVVLWALVELLQTAGAAVRTLPRWAWAVLIVALPPLGAVAWFLLGRPQAAGVLSRPAPTMPLRRKQAYVSRPAPDDDPEFLALLNARADQQRRLRRMEEDLGPGDGAEPETDRPE